MLRAVLAVVLSVALLGVATPVVEDARVQRSSHLVEGELSRVAERTIGLAATEETGPGAAPRRVVALSLPSGEFVTAPIDYVAIGGVPDCRTPRDTERSDVVAYKLRGADAHVRTVPVDLRVVTDGRVRDDEDPLVLRGDARVALSLADRDAGPTVLVRRGGAVTPATTGRQQGDRRA